MLLRYAASLQLHDWLSRPPGGGLSASHGHFWPCIHWPTANSGAQLPAKDRQTIPVVIVRALSSASDQSGPGSFVDVEPGVLLGGQVVDTVRLAFVLMGCRGPEILPHITHVGDHPLRGGKVVSVDSVTTPPCLCVVPRDQRFLGLHLAESSMPSKRLPSFRGSCAPSEVLSVQGLGLTCCRRVPVGTLHLWLV